jgi:CubicO group peptidase (beta-lactamase class C family)
MTQQERAVQAHLDRLIHAGTIPGMQYLVLDAQGIRFEYYGGHRDLTAQLPVTTDTTFMASSSTKVVTAAAILQLVAHGQVQLDAPLSSYYPDHPYGNEVTIRHLVNQSSGIPNPLPLRWLHRVEEHATFDEVQARHAVMRQHPQLSFPPGTKYAYSNLSYWLLGAVIEAVSGQSYRDYLRQHVVAPLGAAPEELDVLIPDLRQHAHGYQHKYSPQGLVLYLMMDRTVLAGTEARRFRLRPVYMNGPAYGGLIGTARGFAQFLHDQLRTQPLLFDAGTKTLFYTHQRDNRGHALPTTLGWHHGQVGGVPYYGKPGGGPGFRSNLRVYPNRALATVWFINETGTSEGPINHFTDRLDRHFLTK